MSLLILIMYIENLLTGNLSTGNLISGNLLIGTRQLAFVYSYAK
jgi:hypothetical protein